MKFLLERHFALTLAAGLVLLAIAAAPAEVLSATGEMNLWTGEGASWRNGIASPPLWSNAPLPAMEASVTGAPAHTALLCLHIIGLAAGFGGALFLDIYLLRHLYARPITPQALEIVAFGEKVVAGGLSLLWLSGLGFLALYWLYAPSQLANPKIGVKLAIVLALSINGLVIHRYIGPRARGKIGAPLLAHEPLAHALPFLVPAAISFTSWFSALLLGVIPQLNHAAAFGNLFFAFLAMLAVSIVCAMMLHALITRVSMQRVAAQTDAPRQRGARSQVRTAVTDSVAIACAALASSTAQMRRFHTVRVNRSGSGERAARPSAAPKLAFALPHPRSTNRPDVPIRQLLRDMRAI